MCCQSWNETTNFFTRFSSISPSLCIFSIFSIFIQKALFIFSLFNCSKKIKRKKYNKNLFHKSHWQRRIERNPILRILSRDATPLRSPYTQDEGGERHLILHEYTVFLQRRNLLEFPRLLKERNLLFIYIIRNFFNKLFVTFQLLRNRYKSFLPKGIFVWSWFIF